MKSHNTKLRKNILAQSLAFAFGAIAASGALASVPVVSSYSPADNSLKVVPSANLVLNFNQVVFANNGKNIVIKKASDDSVVEAIDAANTGKVTLSSSKNSTSVTINPANVLALGTDYYVQIDSGAFIDNTIPPTYYSGIGDTTSWNFATVAGATPLSYFPNGGATNFDGTTNLALTFSEAMTPVAGKNIQIYQSNGTLFESIATTDAAKVTISGSSVVINPAAVLALGGYYIHIDAGAFTGNVSNASYAGIADSTTWAFSSVTDVTPPTATFSPANNATGVATGANLELSFNEIITAAAGKNITIKRSLDDSVAETMGANDTSKVSVSSSKGVGHVTINPTNSLAFGTGYYIQIDPGAFKDPASNPYAGITDTTTWHFTTATGATPVSSNPANGATGFNDYANLSLTFSEPMTPVAGKNIQIFKSNGTLFETIGATDTSKVTFSGSAIVINPAANLLAGSYYVNMDAGAFTGVQSGVPCAGITSPTSWAFSTVTDAVAPTATFSPADNSTGFPPTSNLIISFSEFVTAVAGKNILIRKSSDNSVVETIAASDAAKVTFSSSKSSNSAVINPTANLAFDTAYYVQVDPGAFQDPASNPYAGFLDTTTWNFTTAHDAIPPVYTVTPHVVGTPSSNSALFSATVDEPGHLYYIVVPAASAPPTPAQVKAGINYGAVPVLGYLNTAVDGNVASSLPVNFPNANTAYAVYFIAEDTVGNLQTSVLGVNVTTAVPTGPQGTLGATSYVFPAQSIGTTSYAAAVTLTNTGSDAMTISGISATGDYATTNNCGSGLGVGSFCSISFTFSPTVSGARTGTITAITNAYNSPHTISVSGTGQGSIIGLNPSALAFGSQLVNTASPMLTSTLTNTGNQTVNITSVTASGNFAVTNNCGSGLIAGGSCSLNVIFAPTLIGAQTGTISISSSSPTSPHVVALSGTGISAPAPVCTLIATPAFVTVNGTSVLTSICTNTPTSYAWTGGTCAGNTGPSCTVTPATTTTYTVTGTNAGGSGLASTTVTVGGFDIAPILMLLLD